MADRALWHAWRLGQEQRNYVVLAILIFTMGAMATGVDTLIARPIDQWMLFWFPLALLMSYQTIATHAKRQTRKNDGPSDPGFSQKIDHRDGPQDTYNR